MDETAGQELPLKFNGPYKDKQPNAKKTAKRQYSGSEYYLLEDQISDVVNAAKSLRDKIVIRLLGITGGRRFEVRDMRIQDIDFENKRIWIDRGKGGDSKSQDPEERRSRWVDIDDEELVKELKMYIGNRSKGRIVQSHNKKTDGIDISGINRIVAKTAELAKIKNPNPMPKKIRGNKLVERHVNPHLFRHTMGRRKIPLAAKQKLMGHRDAKTTLQMYGKLTFEDAREYAKEARNKIKENKEVSKTKYCHECGAALPTEANFCVGCGAKQ